MNRKLLFFGMGLLSATFVGFLLRLGDGLFLNNKWTLFVPFFLIGAFLVVFGLVKKGVHKSSTTFLGLGFLVWSVLVFVLRFLGLNDNMVLFVLFLFVSIGFLWWGVKKRK